MSYLNDPYGEQQFVQQIQQQQMIPPQQVMVMQPSSAQRPSQKLMSPRSQQVMFGTMPTAIQQHQNTTTASTANLYRTPTVQVKSRQQAAAMQQPVQVQQVPVMVGVFKVPVQPIVVRQPVYVVKPQIEMQQPVFYEDQMQEQTVVAPMQQTTYVPEQQTVHYVDAYDQQQETRFLEPQQPPFFQDDVELFDTQFPELAGPDTAVPPLQIEQVQPKVLKSNFNRKTNVKNQSPRVTAIPYSARNADRANQYEQANRANQYEQAIDNDQEFLGDDWETISQNVDRQYKRKLKEATDDALYKLKRQQSDNRALLDRTQDLIARNRLEDQIEQDQLFNYDQQQRPIAYTERKNQDDFRQRQPPMKLKAAPKGAQFMRESQISPIRNQQPKYEENITQSAPNQRRYQEQPVQQVKQFLEQPPTLYQQQQVQMVQAPPQYQYVPAQQPVRQVVPRQQQQPQTYQDTVQNPQYVPQQPTVVQQQMQPMKVMRRDPIYQSQSYDVKNQTPAFGTNVTYQLSEPVGTRFQQQQEKGQAQRMKSAPRDAQRDQSPQNARIYRGRSVSNERPGQNVNPNMGNVQQLKPPNQYGSTLSPLQEEEPICVLKVELEGGQEAQWLRVYDGQIPEEVVEEFGQTHRLSEYAKHKLVQRIYDSIQL